MHDNAMLKFTQLAASQVMIAQKVISGIFPGVTTSQLDELAAETGKFDAYICVRILLKTCVGHGIGAYSNRIVCQS